MKNIKSFKEFKEPTVIWEELARDYREDKRSDKDSVAAKPFSAKDIESIHTANMVIKDEKKKD